MRTLANLIFLVKTSNLDKLLSAMSFYAVKVGKIPGVYNTWSECQSQVNKFPHPIFKKFASYDDALAFINDGKSPSFKKTETPVETTNAPSPSSVHNSGTSPSSVHNSGTNQNILKQLSEMRAEMKSLRAEVKCLTETVNRLNSAVFVAPGSKRSIHTSSSSLDHNERSEKIAKLEDDNANFTGAPFPEASGTHVYTDGGCFNNGFKGARAGIGVYWSDGSPHNVSESLPGRPTNNRAEIHAAVRAIQIAKSRGISNLILHTDSQFVINSITKWIKKWKKNGWMLTTGKPVINREDFEVLDAALEGMNVKWKYVKGHSGDPGNEAVDRLAKQGAEQA